MRITSLVYRFIKNANLDEQHREALHNYTWCAEKRSSNSAALKYLKKCHREGVIPKFIKGRAINHVAARTPQTPEQIFQGQWRRLCLEITKKEKYDQYLQDSEQAAYMKAYNFVAHNHKLWDDFIETINESLIMIENKMQSKIDKTFSSISDSEDERYSSSKKLKWMNSRPMIRAPAPVYRPRPPDNAFYDGFSGLGPSFIHPRSSNDISRSSRYGFARPERYFS